MCLFDVRLWENPKTPIACYVFDFIALIIAKMANLNFFESNGPDREGCLSSNYALCGNVYLRTAT